MGVIQGPTKEEEYEKWVAAGALLSPHVLALCVHSFAVASTGRALHCVLLHFAHLLHTHELVCCVLKLAMCSATHPQAGAGDHHSDSCEQARAAGQADL